MRRWIRTRKKNTKNGRIWLEEWGRRALCALNFTALFVVFIETGKAEPLLHRRTRYVIELHNRKSHPSGDFFLWKIDVDSSGSSNQDTTRPEPAGVKSRNRVLAVIVCLVHVSTHIKYLSLGDFFSFTTQASDSLSSFLSVKSLSALNSL